MQQETPTSALPGDPATIWADAASSRAARLDRPRDAPVPESADEVARWEDPDRLGRTELIYAPIFWVCLPLAVVGYLIWGTLVHSGDGWTSNLFDEDATGNLWNFWIAWAGVGVWLLVAIGVLVFRLSLIKDVDAQNARIFEHGVLHTIHRSPYDSDDGEGGSWPTFIAIDHRTADEHASRLYHALHTWLSNDAVHDALDSGRLQRRRTIVTTELFGDDAIGGYFLSTIPGSGTAAHCAGHRWVLITGGLDNDREVTVTTVPLEKKLRRIRRKLRRKAARSEPSLPVRGKR
ncbi:hypothetical protein [Gordonia liuliyuniae]|uniref:Uncharacterized protein n=1 Tax=Gordonia liuliyuniae TaxID=2911517 RepID=A0ABS9INL5_9ACTN|nr:hypothetical protein [Gordonia liuliyuniae]MCF8587160.1 hypothetical protein [Gordonia liuliyuniae]